MAAPQTITGLTLLNSGNLSYATLVVQDPNGNLAAGTTEFLQTPSGLLVPKRADKLGTQLNTSRITSALTTTTLAASAAYTQGWQDAQSLAVTYVGGSVTADQSGTLTINFSDDGSTIAKTTTLLTFVPNAAGTANAQAIPYPVQIPTRYFQFVYTNGVTAQGTFALYQTPMSDWSPRDVGLTGSLPAHAVKGPTLVGTVPYSDFVASTVYDFYLKDCLTLGATRRMIKVTNALNESLTDVTINIINHSDMGVYGEVSQVSMGSGQVPASMTSAYYNSEEYPSLITDAQSLQVLLGMGATLPTSGNVYIYVLEVI